MGIKFMYTFEVWSVGYEMAKGEKSILWKLVAAALMIPVAFSYSALFDVPGSLQRIIEDEFDVPAYKYELLYTMYAVSAVIVCPLCGVVIDRYLGLFRGTIVVCCLSLFGQMVITIGGYVNNLWVFCAGRLMLGFGEESIVVVLMCMIVIWFNDKQTYFMFGLVQCFNRLGSTFQFFFAVHLYERLTYDNNVPGKYVFGTTLLPSLGLILIQVSCLILLAFLTKKFNLIPEESNESAKLSQALQLPLLFWVTIVMFSLISGILYTFISCAQEYFELKYNLNLEKADNLSTVFILVIALSGPIFGLVAYFSGRALFWIFLSISLAITSLATFTFTMVTPLLPITVLSLSLSLFFVCARPLPSLIVEKHQLATGYSLMGSFLNLNGLTEIFAGYLLENYRPFSVTLFFMVNCLVGLICNIVIFSMDRVHKGVLNLSKKQMRKRIDDYT